MSAAPQISVPLRGSGVSGGRLLATDVRVAALLLNDARYRAFQRLFAIDRDQVNLVTFIALLVLAQKTEATSHRIRSQRGPTMAEDFMGFAVVREALRRVAGPSSDTPLLGTLLAVAVIGGTARSGLRAIHGSGHQADVAFH